MISGPEQHETYPNRVTCVTTIVNSESEMDTYGTLILHYNTQWIRVMKSLAVYD